MLIAQIIPTGEGEIGAVTVAETGFTVVFRWTSDMGTWYPLYGVTDDLENVDLPPCFSPSDEMLDALNQARDANDD